MSEHDFKVLIIPDHFGGPKPLPDDGLLERDVSCLEEIRTGLKALDARLADMQSGMTALEGRVADMETSLKSISDTLDAKLKDVGELIAYVREMQAMDERQLNMSIRRRMAVPFHKSTSRTLREILTVQDR